MVDPSTERRGSWVFVSSLGSGGFGKVLLWKNEENDQHVALKYLRFSLADLKQNVYDRWIQEIKIMNLLDHENVVRAVPLPQELADIPSETPMLAMEYCVGGDLRRVLGRPGNYCGLSEFQLRAICHDMMSAIEYLHSKHVIHRDIKPENIVIQQIDDKTIYKLIDLGYAKELNDSSIAQSLVGTYEYLAPELITQKYTKTVDYWCFGTVVFEIITGFRPFLPNVSPYQWHNNISKKNNQDIYVYQDDKKNITFKQTIPFPHYLSRTMKVYMEKFLRLMLLWDPRQRGGPLDESGRPSCFKMLEDIFAAKIMQVLCMPTNQILTYPVKEKHSIDEILVALEKETKIPKNEQELTYALGQPADSNKPATQFWMEPIPEWPVHVYMFRKHSNELKSSSPEITPIEPSPLVQTLIANPQNVSQYIKKCWGEAVYYCRDCSQKYLHLAHGRKAAIFYLLRINSTFSKKKIQLLGDMKCFMSNRKYFESSLRLDCEKYYQQLETGIKSDRMFERWEKMKDEVEAMSGLASQVEEIESKCAEMQTKIIELQKSPYAKNKPETLLREIADKSEVLFQDLKNKLGVHEVTHFDQNMELQNHVVEGNVKMRQLLLQSQKTWDKLVHDLYIHLDKILNYKFELLQIVPRVEELLDAVKQADLKVQKNQSKRQDDIWKLVKVACSRNQPTSRRLSSLSNTSSDSGEVSFFDRAQEDSMMVINENNESRTRLLGVCGSLHESINSTNDSWNFLENSNDPHR